MPTTLEQTADGLEVVETVQDAEANSIPPLLILDRVTAFMDQHELGEGPITWRRIGEGQSNVTYLLVRNGQRFVLRRGPRPPLPKSTHDMVREAKIQQLVGAEGVPVPEIHAVCEDESLLGVPFYIMNFLEGDVVTDAAPATLSSPDDKATLGRVLVDTLLKLHSVDITKPGLADLGRPVGYLERQVKRFASLWDVNSKRDLPEVAHIAQILADNLPETQKHSLVHGDYRIGNLMFAPDSPLRVKAILDWEMATLGDPLADLGYMVATYADPGTDPNLMELTTITRQPGYWTRDDLIEYYAQQSGLDVSSLPWYAALALWKSSIFCEAIYTRWLDGERPDDDFGASLKDGIPKLLDQALGYLNQLN
jgi:aminoglycoside phosphotransferase (APT) family kinase protein